jgi:hypothetical protein
MPRALAGYMNLTPSSLLGSGFVVRQVSGSEMGFGLFEFVQKRLCDRARAYDYLGSGPRAVFFSWGQRLGGGGSVRFSGQIP